MGAGDGYPPLHGVGRTICPGFSIADRDVGSAYPLPRIGDEADEFPSSRPFEPIEGVVPNGPVGAPMIGLRSSFRVSATHPRERVVTRGG
jgi:hypothetical protein